MRFMFSNVFLSVSVKIWWTGLAENFDVVVFMTKDELINFRPLSTQSAVSVFSVDWGIFLRRDLDQEWLQR